MEILKKLRDKQGKTQSEIAKQLNIAKTTYAGYEQGKSEPSIQMLKALANIYQVTVDYLVGENKEAAIKTLSNEALQIAILYDLCNDAGKSRFQGCRDAVLGYMDLEQQAEYNKTLQLNS